MLFLSTYKKKEVFITFIDFFLVSISFAWEMFIQLL